MGHDIIPLMNSLLEKLKLNDLNKKQWLFGGFLLISGILFWLVLYSLFLGALFFSIAISLGVVWLVAAGFGMLFLEGRLLLIIYSVLSVLILILFGFRSFNFWGVLLFFVAIIFAHYRARRMRDSLSHFREIYITRRFYPIFLTGLAILLAFSWQSFILGDLEEAPQISENVYSVIFSPSEVIVSSLVPGYTSGMTIGEAQQVLQKGLFSSIFPSDGVEDFFGNNGNRTSGLQDNLMSLTLEDFTRIWINTNIKSTFDPYLGLAPFFIILGLFFVLKLLFWYLKWFILIFLWLAIKLMKMYNVFTIKEVQTTTRVPVLD